MLLNFRVKYIARARGAVLLDVHVVEQFAPGYRIAVVPHQMGLSHHYRGMCCYDFTITYDGSSQKPFLTSRRTWDLLPGFLLNYEAMSRNLTDFHCSRS